MLSSLSFCKHKEGHICALLRVSAAPARPLYYILGGDSCHHHEMLTSGSSSETREHTKKPRIGFWLTNGVVGDGNGNGDGQDVMCYHVHPPLSVSPTTSLLARNKEAAVAAWIGLRCVPPWGFPHAVRDHLLPRKNGARR